MLLDITFTGSEDPISQSGKWVNGKTDGVLWQDVQTVAGKAFATGFAGDRFEGSEFDDDIAHYKASVLTVPADFWIEGTIGYAYSGMPPARHEIELLGRFEITPSNARGYETLIGAEPGGLSIAQVKWDGILGDFKAIYDPGNGSIAFVDDDVLRMEYRGSTATGKLNGSIISGMASLDLTKDVGGATLATWDTGQPGIGMWPVNGTTLSSFYWKRIRVGTF